MFVKALLNMKEESLKSALGSRMGAAERAENNEESLAPIGFGCS
jgi:hypothetical protein